MVCIKHVFHFNINEVPLYVDIPSLLQKLLSQQVRPDICDIHGVTLLHITRDPTILQVFILHVDIYVGLMLLWRVDPYISSVCSVLCVGDVGV